jgi:lysine 6-dehydrogenase
VLRHGKAIQVEALGGIETVPFSAPLGDLEAFHTGGGISTMPFAWEGKIETMEYKTLRYPGHAAIMRPIRDLGLISSQPIDVKGHPVRPRDLFIAAVQPKLHRSQGHDLVALRVTASGTSGGSPASTTFDLLDYYDETHGISAMMRATGFSLSLTGQLQVGGKVTTLGVRTPDEAMPFRPYVDGLARHGVTIRER